MLQYSPGSWTRASFAQLDCCWGGLPRVGQVWRGVFCLRAECAFRVASCSVSLATVGGVAVESLRGLFAG